ncbi:MAG TPA: hypothetical protein VN521_06150 [Negativicutes bacterium]|nr:hypothetical protein [Negativicutes bacterium]
MKITEYGIMLLIAGVMVVIGNKVGIGNTPAAPVGEAIVGYVIMVAITLVGIIVQRVLPFKLPIVFWVSIVAILSTTPISPFAKTIIYYTDKVAFLALCTPILAYAGLGVGKDLEDFKKISWKIVIVALCVYTGTFVFATAVAQVMLHVEGVI